MNIYLQPLYSTGALAQLVEQRTENPCVPGSIPGGTTAKPRSHDRGFLFCINDFIFFQLLQFYKRSIKKSRKKFPAFFMHRVLS